MKKFLHKSTWLSTCGFHRRLRQLAQEGSTDFDITYTCPNCFTPSYISWTFFRLRNDLYCVEWGVKLYSLTYSAGHSTTSPV